MIPRLFPHSQGCRNQDSGVVRTTPITVGVWQEKLLKSGKRADVVPGFVKTPAKGSPQNYREEQNKMEMCGMQGGIGKSISFPSFWEQGVWGAGSDFHLLLVQPCPTSSRFFTHLSSSGAKNKPEGFLSKKGLSCELWKLRKKLFYPKLGISM